MSSTQQTFSIPRRREFAEARHKEISILPWWKKTLAYFFWGAQIIGGTTLGFGLFSFSLIGVISGIALMVVFGLLYQVAVRGRRLSGNKIE